MPLKPASQIQSRVALPMVAPVAEVVTKPLQTEPGFFETLGAMFGSEWTPAATYRGVSEWINATGELQDDAFDPFDEIKGTDLEAYPDAFVDVYSRPQFDRRAEQLRDEIRDRDIIARSPVWAGITAGLLTGVVEPVNYIAFAGPVSRSMAALKGGRAALTFARESATAALLSTVASEAILQNDQYLRTMEESAANIIFATGIGGSLGGVIGAAVERGLKKAAASSERAALEAAIEGRFARVMAENGDEVAAPVAPVADVIDEVAPAITNEGPKAPQYREVWKDTDEVVPGVMSIGEDGVSRPVYRRVKVMELIDDTPPVLDVPPAPPPSTSLVEDAAPKFREVWKETGEVVPGAVSIGDDGVGRPVYRKVKVLEPIEPDVPPPPKAKEPDAVSDAPPAEQSASIPKNDAEVIPGLSSASSAAVAPADMPEIMGAGPIRQKIAEGLSAPSRRIGIVGRLFDNPTAWMLTSPFRAVREIAEKLAYTPTLTKNALGVATEVPAEALVAVSRGMAAAVTKATRDFFTRYRFGLNAGKTWGSRFTENVAAAKLQDKFGSPSGKLDFKAFKAAAYDVVRDGVAHPIPEVNELAADIGKKLDLVKQEAIDVGSLPANVEPVTAKNHIMRLYDRPKIIAKRRVLETIVRKWMRENADKIRLEAADARKVVDDLKAQRDAMRAEMTQDEWAIYESERKWQDAQRRVEQASEEQKRLEGAVEKADFRLTQLKSSPNAPGLQDLIARADEDLKLAQDDLTAAIADHTAAVDARNIARTQYSFRNDKLKSHPIYKARMRLQRRQEHLDRLKAQAEIAERNLKALDAELEQAGRGPKVYAEWLDRRADKMPPGKRPMSLVDLIIARGGIRDEKGELRKIVDAVLKKDQKKYVDKKYQDNTGTGKKARRSMAARRDKLERLISKSEEAPRLDDATLTYWEEGYLGKFSDDGAAERPEINELLDAIDAEASSGLRLYSFNDLDNVNAWEDFDWAKARRDELRADPDFRAGRAITTLINKWKKQAAAKVAEVDAKGAIILRERNAARAKLDGMVARANDLERARRTLERRIEHETARAESFEDVYYKTDEELSGIVTQLVDDLLGMPGEMTAANLSEIGAKRRGPLADRTLLIPDDYDAGPLMIDGIQHSGRFDQFVVKDVDRVMHAVARSTGPDLALMRTFGSVDLKDEFARIAEDAKAHRQHIGLQQEREIAALGSNASPDAVAKIEAKYQREMNRSYKEQSRAKRILEVQVARLRGTFTGGLKPDSLFYRFAENAKTLNYIRLMGAVVPASLADATMVARAHGLDRVIKAASVAAGDWESFKAAMKTAPQVGQAIDRVLSMRAAAIGDLDAQFFARSKPEEVLQYIGQMFGNLNLLSQWTDFWKSFDVVVAQDRILGNVKTFMESGTLSPLERQFMADHYLGEREMARLWGQFKHTKSASGLRWAELADWDDSEAKRLFSAAIARDADFNIITPGLDKPIWLSTPVGSVIGQFKSFTFVAMNRILVSALQQDAASAAMGLSLLALGGAFSYMVSAALKGDNPFEQDAVKWAAEAIDRSGMTGWLAEVNAFADKLGVGVNTALGGRELSRYASRNAEDQIGGPTVGAIFGDGGLLSTFSAIASSDKDLTGQNVGFVRQMLPGNNLFYARWLFDAVERNSAKTLGVKPRPSVQ